MIESRHQSVGPTEDRLEDPPGATAHAVRLDHFQSTLGTGRSHLLRALWYFVSLLVFESGLFPCYGPKRTLLRLFGAHIGRGVVIKPHVRIKYPWRLAVGDHCWIGQGVWIDNLDTVTIGPHCCLSQAVYLCTGSHDTRSPSFDLETAPIELRQGSWVCARATLLAGVTVGEHAVIGAGAVLHRDAPARKVLAGNPAVVIGPRLIEANRGTSGAEGT